MFIIKKKRPTVRGELTLAGSKSISNRVLIIRALSPAPFEIQRLANAKDTQLLDGLLQTPLEILDVGAAGTTFRFLTAYCALQPGTQILTGSERMKQRPIRALVDALRQLGAEIEYLEKEGYPPLRISETENFGATGKVTIAANTSSQYITALLLIAPTLPKGLEITLEGDIVSRPYIEMTLALMGYFGATHTWTGQTIQVPRQTYSPRPFTVEADWSAASYFYSLVAIADEGDLTLRGLFADSLQGDAVLAEMMTHLGVTTEFLADGIRLRKSGVSLPSTFEWNFLECPDVAQTLAVTCAALGVKSTFAGLETLRIKETDRIAALQTELNKVNVPLYPSPVDADHQYFSMEGKAQVVDAPIFHTYEDHRMAMSFAPLALLAPIRIADPEVVVKSYPDFWKDWQTLGFEVDEIEE